MTDVDAEPGLPSSQVFLEPAEAIPERLTTSPSEVLRGASILVAGVYYRPEETGIAPYTTALAEHLADLGARVRAVTAVPHYPAWRVFDGYARAFRTRERLSRVDVLRGRVYVPRRQTALQRALYEASATAQLSLASVPSPDLVVGVIPPLAGGFAAAVHAARARARLGLVVQDLSGPAALQSGMPGGVPAVARLTGRIEAALLRRADGVGIVSAGFRGYIVGSGVGPERVVSLPNWSRLPEPNSPPERTRRELGWPLDRPVVLHAGNMGLKQGLEHVLEAAARASTAGLPVHFVFMGEGSQARALRRRAVGLPNVTFTPLRFGTDYANALAAADILLVNERATVLDMSLPSKLTSYFAAGRPVLAAVAPTGVTAAEIERSGGGIVVQAEDPAALLFGVDRLLTDVALRGRLSAAGRRYAGTWLSEAAGLARVERFAAGLLGSCPEA